MNKKLVLKNSIVGLTILVSSIVVSAAFADDDSVVDQINITVPVSCTMSGTGMQSHNAEITNGTYQADIGSTTLHAFCNDNNGFAIYAAGYTGDEIGGTSSNKLVGTVASGNATIDTGLATSAGNPDVSNWAMKLAISQDSGDTTGTNAFTIDNSFGAYHAVPNDYMKVAHKDSNTDMTASTGGVKLTTTYAAYISKTQPADTYSGQVVYALVHPATTDPPVHPDQIGVNYYENGLGFSSGLPKNRVVYDMACEPMYIANTPIIVKTSNVSDDGVYDGTDATGDVEFYDEVFEGASKIKVVLDYNIISRADLQLYKGDWDEKIFHISNDEINKTGHNKIFVIDSDMIQLDFTYWDDDYSDYFYAKIYPIYTTEQDNTSEVILNSCPPHETTGYVETSSWNGKWYTIIEDEVTYFADESDLNDYFRLRGENLVGSNMDIYAYNPYLVNYNGNGATAGTMTGFTTKFATNDPNSNSDLLAPNFKKTGYGFAGWSKDPNATVNGNSKIYGPNETIRGNELTFDPNTRETTLYAVWVAPSGNMQNFSCSSLAPGKVTALTDTRDNNVYTVGKLQDGSCWMMENLRLDNTATIDATNTDNPVEDFALATSTDDWCTSSAASCTNQSLVNTNNTNIGGTNTSGTTLVIAPGGWDDFRQKHEDGYNGELGYTGKTYQWYEYGNYYNYYTATAGRMGSSGSICPIGWNLPTGGNTPDTVGSFAYLGAHINTNNPLSGHDRSNNWRKFPNNYLYSGSFSISNPISASYGRGDVGLYASSTRTYNTLGLYLWRDKDCPWCTTSNAGHAVRCYNNN